MLRALVVMITVLGSMTPSFAANSKDFTLRCVWTIDGIDHVARSTFRHGSDDQVYVDLVSNGVKCPAYSEPDLTHPNRQYFVKSCPGAVSGDLGSHFWVYRRATAMWTMSRPLGAGLGSARYHCKVEP